MTLATPTPPGHAIARLPLVQPGGRPAFDLPVEPGGYAWWYVDAISDDGEDALTIIALLGSVFSPYYAWAGRRDPLDHASMNVAVYRRRGGAWAMTERGRSSVERSRDGVRIGPSTMTWDDGGLTIELAELGFPVPRRIRGRVRLRPEVRADHVVVLDQHAGHRWWPLAPRARVEVELDAPAVRWRGLGYLDSNAGATSLEDAFVSWSWSRAPLARGASVLYDLTERGGATRAVALRIGADGRVTDFEPPPVQPLPSLRWRVPRATRGDGPVETVRALEDTPFYTRSIIRAKLLGETTEGTHESLSLDRFRSAWVRGLLPFRMPRRAR